MGTWLPGPIRFVMPGGLDGVRRSWDPDGLLGGVPEYLLGMGQYDVRQLTGGTYGPASGVETTAQMIPSVAGNNWAATHTGAGLAAWNGGIWLPDDRTLVWNIEGHNDNGGSFNGLFSFDFTAAVGRPLGGALLTGSLTDIDDVTAAGSAIETYSADGRPGARHTYKGFARDRVTGLIYTIGGSLYSTGGKSDYIWSFDPSSGTWEQVIQHATNLSAGSVRYCITDDDARKVLIFGGDVYYQFFDMAAQTLSARKTFDAGHQTSADVPVLESGAGYDPTRQRVVFIGSDTAKLQNLTVDWDAETVTHNDNLTFTGASAHLRNGVSVLYDPTDDAFVALAGEIVAAGNSTTYSNLYTFDAAISNPASVPVTTQALGAAIPVTTGMRGSWDRFALVDDWRCILGVGSHQHAPVAISLTDRS